MFTKSKIKKFVFIILIILYSVELAKAGAETINWCGISWNLASHNSNAWIEDGQLHMKLEQENGVWQGALLESTEKVKYGKFTWVFSSPSLNLERNTTIGLFTYHDNKNELDIEINQWPGMDEHLFFVNQPGSIDSHPDLISYGVFSSNPYLMDENIIYTIEWTPAYVHYSAVTEEGKTIQEWTYSDQDGITDLESTICMDLLNLDRKYYPASGEASEVVLKSFKYTPYGAPEQENYPDTISGKETVKGYTVKDIQEAIDKADSNVFLPAGKYILTGSLVLKSDIVLEGEEGTILTIPDKAGWDVWQPLIKGTGVQNVVIKNIEFNGNSDNNQDVGLKTHNGKAWGNGYYNFIHVIDSDSITVENCLMRDGLGDGLRAKTSTNIIFRNNEAYRLGHEGAYFIDCENVEASGNQITTRTSNALRVWNSAHVRFFDNVLDSDLNLKSLAGMGGFQIEDSKGTLSDIEICNNVIKNTWGPAIWLIAYDNGLSNTQAVSIHHNLFYQVAQSYNIGYAAGITVNGQKGTEIKNNVFDGAYNAAILALSGGKDSTIEDNIITDTRKHTGINQAGTGSGIVNRAGSSFSVLNNCFFENENGNLYSCTSSGDDLEDPKTHTTSSGWTWTGTTWTYEYVDPSDMEEIKPADPEANNNDTDTHEIVFDDIFDILKITFSTSGRTEQTAEDIKYEVKETTSGLIAGYVKIVGFKDVVTIDNVSYIPDENAVLVKYKAVKSPDLDGWAGHIKKINKDLDIKIENGKAYAVRTVKTDWYTVKKDPATGKSKKSKIKTSKAVFRDSCTAPDILRRPTQAKGYINEYRSNSTPNTRVYIPSEGLTKIVFEYAGNTSEHFFLLGERQTDEKGIISTAYTSVDYWDGSPSYLGDSLIIYGHFDQDKLKVTCYTPYESFEVTDFKHTVYEMPKDNWTKPLIAFLLRFFLMLLCGYKLMRVIIPP